MFAIRDAALSDAPAILALLDQLGWSAFTRRRVNRDYIGGYLQFPFNNILLAETTIEPPTTGVHSGSLSGLLAYSTRPDLYHGGLTALIENFVVRLDQRDQGVGSALIKHLIDRLYEMECVALFVDVEPDNHDAIRFYRRHGLDNQVTLLERHL